VLERDAAGILPDDRIKRLTGLLDGLESVADIAELTSCLSR